MKQKKYSNLATYDSYKRNQKLLVAVVVLAVLAVIAMALYFWWSAAARQSSITSIELISNSGPVSPEYQYNKTLVITKDSCKITDNTDSTDQTQQPCTLNADGYKAIVNSYYQNDVAGSIAANNSSGQQTLIGGPQKQIVVKKSDGSVLQTKATLEFIKNIQPFLNIVGQNVTQYSSLNF